jgi:hypothetical protein
MKTRRVVLIVIAGAALLALCAAIPYVLTEWQKAVRTAKIEAWKREVAARCPAVSPGANVVASVSIMYLDDYFHQWGLQPHFCLAIDGRVVFEGRVEVRASGPVCSQEPMTWLATGVTLTEGKHIIDAFDAARGVKATVEVDVKKDAQWLVIENEENSRTISVSVHYEAGLLFQ